MRSMRIILYMRKLEKVSLLTSIDVQRNQLMKSMPSKS